jgi:hypothetical protein
MELTIQNKFKATVLQILNSVKSKYLTIGKQLKYTIKNENPLDDSFIISIEPDDIANVISPRLMKFKASNTDSSDKPVPNEAEEKLRNVIREILNKNFKKPLK